MSCSKCNTSCSCAHACGSTKGERGLRGLTGPQGEPGPAGPAGGGVVNRLNFFEEHTDDQAITDTIFYFPPGYEILSWTNNTGAPITIIAHATGQSVRGVGIEESSDVSNDVEMALVRTIVGVDDYTYTHHMRFDLRGGNFDALYVAPLAGVPLTITSPLAPRQLTTDEDNPTEFRFAQSLLSQAAPIMKKITLNNGEAISVKFRSKGSGSTLQSAQLFIQELDM